MEAECSKTPILIAAIKYLTAANEVTQLLSGAYESKLETTIGIQKHKNNGSNRGNNVLILVLCSSDHNRNSREIAKIDKGISASRRKGNNAINDTASQTGHSD